VPFRASIGRMSHAMKGAVNGMPHFAVGRQPEGLASRDLESRNGSMHVGRSQRILRAGEIPFDRRRETRNLAEIFERRQRRGPEIVPACSGIVRIRSGRAAEGAFTTRVNEFRPRFGLEAADPALQGDRCECAARGDE
jgi:hypothetical protein